MYSTPSQNKKHILQIQNFLLRILNTMFPILFAILFFSVCFFSNGIYHFGIWLPINATICLTIFFLIWQKQKSEKVLRIAKRVKNNFYWVMGVTLFLVFIAQISIAYFISTDIGWDVGRIMEAAQAVDLRPHDLYFSRYPNNMFLFLMYRVTLVVFTKIGISQIWFGFSIINILFVDFAIVLTTVGAVQAFGKKVAMVVLVLSIAMFGVFPWLVVPYSDTLSMPFIAGMFLSFIQSVKSEKNKNRIIAAMCLGVFAGVGYLIKPSNIIAFIAVVIIGTIYPPKQHQIKDKKIKIIGFSILAIAVVILMFNTVVKQQKLLQLNKDMQATPLSFFLLGTSKVEYQDGYTLYGTWNEQDIERIMATTTQQEMNEVSSQEIENRIKEMGVWGYTKFLFNKAVWIFSDGTFFWAQEGNFANFTDIPESILKNIFTPAGKLFYLYTIVAQTTWCCILFLLAVPSLFNKKQICLYASVLQCSILGIFLFLLLFEGRARYLIPFLPIFALLAGYNFVIARKNIKAKINQF